MSIARTQPMLQDKIWVPVGHPCWDIASKNTPYVRISVFPNVAPDRYKCRSAKHPTQAFSQFCCCSDGVICSLHIKALHSLEADGAEKEDKTLQAKQKKNPLPKKLEVAGGGRCLTWMSNKMCSVNRNIHTRIAQAHTQRDGL